MKETVSCFMGKAKNTKQLSLLPQASEGESELEAGMGPMCQAACAGLLLPSSGEFSTLTRPGRNSHSLSAEEEAVIHSGGASFPAFLKGTQTDREGLSESKITITTLQFLGVELPEHTTLQRIQHLCSPHFKEQKTSREVVISSLSLNFVAELSGRHGAADRWPWPLIN